MIEEILEALKSHDKVFTETGIKEYPLTLSIEEQKVLLDYITNLQEKYNGIKSNFDIQLEYDKELENKITNLQEENERIRKDYFTLMQDNAYTLKLEQRINKALYIISKLNPDEIPCWFDEIETTLRGEKYE